MAKTSDAAKALAEELGVDIDEVEGTGSKGAVTVEDVRAAAEPQEKTVDVATLSQHQTPPNHDRWVRADWGDDRVFAVGRNLLGPEFGVMPSEISVTKIKRGTTVTWITGHVTVFGGE